MIFFRDYDGASFVDALERILREASNRVDEPLCKEYEEALILLYELLAKNKHLNFPADVLKEWRSNWRLGKRGRASLELDDKGTNEDGTNARGKVSSIPGSAVNVFPSSRVTPYTTPTLVAIPETDEDWAGLIPHLKAYCAKSNNKWGANEGQGLDPNRKRILLLTDRWNKGLEAKLTSELFKYYFGGNLRITVILYNDNGLTGIPFRYSVRPEWWR